MMTLCERCCELDRYSPFAGKEIYLLHLDSNCPLCQQLKIATDTISSTCHPSLRRGLTFMMTKYPAPPGTSGSKWEVGYIGRPRCLQFFAAPEPRFSFSHSPKHRSLVKLVAPNEPDFDFVKASIEECRQQHKDCTKRFPTLNALRLIDCRTRRLCVPDERRPYVCLSYVWGSGSVEDLNDGDRLPDILPKTIEDTFVVALKLGISFVWIDRYCIDQKNPAEKHNIIQNMDRIYQGAELTVIAIGSDPNDGLPGVCGTPRVPQCRLNIGNRTFLSVPTVAPEIKESKWSARAWTFQEGLLSTRRLVFTSSQMYYQCYQDFGLEGVRPDTSLLRHFFQRDYPVFPTTGIGRRPEDLSKLLTEYYRRQLSFGTDTLHAITGIINNFQCEPHTSPPTFALPFPTSFGRSSGSQSQPDISRRSAKNFYGLPVICSASNPDDLRQPFLHSLQWSTYASEKRDTAQPSDLFPSWSWASQKANNANNPVNYLEMPPMMGARPGYGKIWNYLGIGIDVSHTEDGLMSITEFHNHGDDYMSFEPWIDITTWTFEVKLDTDSSKVRIMSDQYTLPNWVPRSRAKTLAVCLSLGVQSTRDGHPDQILVNGLLVVETGPGVYRRIKPFHTGRLLIFMGMSDELKRRWNKALKLMDSNDEIVDAMKPSIDQGWIGPAVLEKLPVEPWRKETLRLI